MCTAADRRRRCPASGPRPRARPQRLGRGPGLGPAPGAGAGRPRGPAAPRQARPAASGGRRKSGGGEEGVAVAVAATGCRTAAVSVAGLSGGGVSSFARRAAESHLPPPCVEKDEMGSFPSGWCPAVGFVGRAIGWALRWRQRCKLARSLGKGRGEENKGLNPCQPSPPRASGPGLGNLISPFSTLAPLSSAEVKLLR